MDTHVVLFGGPISGFEVYGPFATYDEAGDFVQKREGDLGEDWWIMPLASPDETEE